MALYEERQVTTFKRTPYEATHAADELSPEAAAKPIRRIGPAMIQPSQAQDWLDRRLYGSRPTSEKALAEHRDRANGQRILAAIARRPGSTLHVLARDTDLPDHLVRQWLTQHATDHHLVVPDSKPHRYWPAGHSLAKAASAANTPETDQDAHGLRPPVAAPPAHAAPAAAGPADLRTALTADRRNAGVDRRPVGAHLVAPSARPIRQSSRVTAADPLNDTPQIQHAATALRRVLAGEPTGLTVNQLAACHGVSRAFMRCWLRDHGAAHGIGLLKPDLLRWGITGPEAAPCTTTTTPPASPATSIPKTRGRSSSATAPAA